MTLSDRRRRELLSYFSPRHATNPACDEQDKEITELVEDGYLVATDDEGYWLKLTQKGRTYLRIVK